MLTGHDDPDVAERVPDDAEALIREARRRTRRRRTRGALVLLAVGAGVAALAGGGGGSGAPGARGDGAGGRPAGSQRTSPRTAAVTARVISSLDAIAFVSPRVGYGLVQGTAVACSIAVARTGDGGARFGAPVVLASRPCAGAAPAGALAFDGHGDGFAYGPALFATHDGGRSWRRVPQPGTVVAVAAIGRSVWMLEGRCPAGTTDFAARACPLRLLVSGDGGRHWSPAPAQPHGALTTRGALALEPAQGQSWLVRASTRLGYVLANPTPRAGTAPLWRTADGGRTWTARRIPCLRADESVMLAAAPSGALTAVCAAQPGAGFQPKSVAQSLDGGRTWSLHASCGYPSVSSRCRGPLGAGYLGALVATSARTAFVTGPRSLLLVTHDGGASWLPVRAVGDFNAAGGAAGVVFPDPVHGVAFGYRRLWRTADGGRSWRPGRAVVTLGGGLRDRGRARTRP